jgi:phosphatidylserine/phosphatidylglycerophosphate/cardiolipin synthase-like enzyme
MRSGAQTSASARRSLLALAVALALILLPASGVAAVELPSGMKAVDAPVAACFTPPEDCENAIVQVINGARRRIQVQAYSFTSLPILHALREALKRGIAVDLVLDKSDGLKNGSPVLYSPAGLMAAAGAHVWIDNHAGIAHNKVMIIDGELTVGGSFNYSKNAATRNRENVTFIGGTEIAAAFAANWEARRKVSVDFNELVKAKKS